jgi:hypothetical protein
MSQPSIRATAIFAVTDYWSPFFSSPCPKISEGQSLREYGYGNELKHGQNIAESWSQATGRPAKHRQVTMEEVKKRFPTEGEETNRTMYAAEFGYAGGDLGVIEAKDLNSESRPSDIEAWMSQLDWSSIVNLKDSRKL